MDDSTSATDVAPMVHRRGSGDRLFDHHRRDGAARRRRFPLRARALPSAEIRL
jgi:hypothetical protein